MMGDTGLFVILGISVFIVFLCLLCNCIYFRNCNCHGKAVIQHSSTSNFHVEEDAEDRASRLTSPRGHVEYITSRHVLNTDKHIDNADHKLNEIIENPSYNAVIIPATQQKESAGEGSQQLHFISTDNIPVLHVETSTVISTHMPTDFTDAHPLYEEIAYPNQSNDETCDGHIYEEAEVEQALSLFNELDNPYTLPVEELRNGDLYDDCEIVYDHADETMEKTFPTLTAAILVTPEMEPVYSEIIEQTDPKLNPSGDDHIYNELEDENQATRQTDQAGWDLINPIYESAVSLQGNVQRAGMCDEHQYFPLKLDDAIPGVSDENVYEEPVCCMRHGRNQVISSSGDGLYTCRSSEDRQPQVTGNSYKNRYTRLHEAVSCSHQRSSSPGSLEVVPENAVEVLRAHNVATRPATEMAASNYRKRGLEASAKPAREALQTIDNQQKPTKRSTSHIKHFCENVPFQENHVNSSSDKGEEIRRLGLGNHLQEQHFSLWISDDEITF